MWSVYIQVSLNGISSSTYIEVCQALHCVGPFPVIHHLWYSNGLERPHLVIQLWHL